MREYVVDGGPYMSLKLVGVGVEFLEDVVGP